jgi:transglutaminase-like putative cysteine protease
MATRANKSVIRMALGGVKLETAVAADAPGQTFRNNPDGSVTVTVVALDPPAKQSNDAIPDAVKPYLANTSMVPWTDSAIMEAAANLAPADANAWTVTRLATAWVNAKLRKERPERGMLTAKETLERGCGDCTEHSVLLAAILRARGIPARLAAGIAYVGGQFGFHMWDLAWVGGEWIPVDATFGYAPIPADRITMALVGADDKVENVAASLLPALGQLEITVESSE